MSSEFLERFHAVWIRKRRVQLAQVVGATLLMGVIGFGGLALVDYAFELRYEVRAAALVLVASAVLIYGIHSFWRKMQNWSRPATAAEIEEIFPKLGQSVRTTVQYSALPSEQVKAAGVASSLVKALADETNTQTKPLPLDSVVPKKRLILVASAAAIGLLLLTGAAGIDWEWRTASQRAALSDQPYRQLIVNPTSFVLDEGGSAEIAIALVGRTNREVAFYTRPTGQSDAEWTERILERTEDTAEPTVGEDDARQSGSSPSAATDSLPKVEFVARLNRLTKPLDYRVIAGDLASDVYRIDIRRPLKLQQVKVDLTPPAYTGQSTSSVLDANVSALQGTIAQFVVTFDKPVKDASIVLAPRRTSADQDEPVLPETIPLVLGQSTGAASAESVGTAELTLNDDRTYSITANAIDGTQLVENKFRIRIREDQAPQVFFESPDDSIEVHTLAELPMRIRVRDDYGITKSGVIFQVNNEQEIPLIAEDFAVVAQAAEEHATQGKVTPTTQVALEKILPLEHFELTQKDSVMYFAYAEDNLPGRPQRTETDMRFIDIRPFKRQYQVLDPDPMNGMGMGTPLKTLEELIQRQRFALNRTIQFEKRAALGQRPDANSLEQLMKFETDLAQFVRETALGLESRGFDDTELFYQAEAAMLQAVDSLSVGKWDNATLQMRDALKFLIEQRDRTALAILKNPDPARLAALRAFDRQQAQKLRRPKSDKEEARELIQRLEGLASQENDVASALGDQLEPKEDMKSEPGTNEAPKPAEQGAAPAESKTEDQPATENK